MKKWGDIELRNATSDFLNFIDKKELEKKYGRKFHNIVVKMQSIGITRGFEPLIENIKDVVREYESGVSAKKIAETHDVDASVIKRILISNNISIRRVSKKYYFNEAYFQKINSEDKAYFLGLLFADGCNVISERKTRLTVQTEDNYILDVFKKHLLLNKPVSHKEKYSVLAINSPQISKDLFKLGCTNKKSLTLKFPKKVPIRLMRHFIRGYFDGDGCISLGVGGFHFNMVSTTSFLNEVQKIFCKKLGLSKTKFQSAKNPKVKILKYSGRINCLKIKLYLYKDATIFLKRKFNKFNSINKTLSRLTRTNEKLLIKKASNN